LGFVSDGNVLFEILPHFLLNFFYLIDKEIRVRNQEKSFFNDGLLVFFIFFSFFAFYLSLGLIGYFLVPKYDDVLVGSFF